VYLPGKPQRGDRFIAQKTWQKRKCQVKKLLLRQKLQGTDFKQIAGFPHATDEAILALSDPPYYTACPNPWLSDL